MKIQVERDVLAEAVAWTARALPARPTVPVLAGMRLHAGAELTLSSFDYDVSAEARIAVTAEEEGSALVSGRLLAEISRSLPSRPVQISSDGGRAVLTCGSSTFTLLTMPEDEYPALPQMPPAAGSVGSDAFASAVSQSATAAGRDDTLPALTGVRIEIEGDAITLISTDRYRLAMRELRWTPVRPDMSAAVLVPARALADTARSLTSGAEVSIALALPGDAGSGGDGMIGFEGAGRRVGRRFDLATARQWTGWYHLAAVDARLIDGQIGGDEEAAGLGLLQDVAEADLGQIARGRPQLERPVEDCRLQRREQEPAPASIPLSPLPAEQRQARRRVVAAGAEALGAEAVRHAARHQRREPPLEGGEVGVVGGAGQHHLEAVAAQMPEAQLVRVRHRLQDLEVGVRNRQRALGCDARKAQPLPGQETPWHFH